LYTLLSNQGLQQYIDDEGWFFWTWNCNLLIEQLAEVYMTNPNTHDAYLLLMIKIGKNKKWSNMIFSSLFKENTDNWHLINALDERIVLSFL
jgi:hypothetical protein